MVSWTRYEESIDKIELEKARELEAIQDKLMEGCGNCSTGIQTRKSLNFLVYSDLPDYDWDEWRCLNPDCPESLDWHNIYDEEAP